MPASNKPASALQALLSILEDQYADALMDQKHPKHLQELWDQIRQLRRQLETGEDEDSPSESSAD